MEDVDLSVASEDSPTLWELLSTIEFSREWWPELQEAMDGQKPESFMIKDNQNRVLPFEELEDGDITLEPMNFPLSLFRQAFNDDFSLNSFQQDGPDYQESEFPCEHEVSITEDVRALIEWVRPNDLSATIRDSVEYSEHNSEILARAAMLFPVSLNSFRNKEGDHPKCMVSLRRGMYGLIIAFVLVTCAGMYHVMETSTSAIRSQAIETCNQALGVQTSTVDKLVSDNVTAKTFDKALGAISTSFKKHIFVPADRGLESIWGSLRTLRLMGSWDGNIEDIKDEILYRIWVELDSQWSLQDGPFGSRPTPVPDQQEVLKNQLEGLSIIGLAGQSAGMAGSSFSVDCPGAGPTMCGSCRGKCHHLDLHSSNSPAVESGLTTLVSRGVEASTGRRVGDPLLVLQHNWRKVPGFEVQQQYADEAQRSSSPVEAQKMWSKLFQFADGITRMSWTAPISDCGSYSCFSGVISADVMLGTVSTDCTEELAKLSKMLHSGYNYPLGEGNSSMFVVNHVSDRFPEQIGTLLGTAHNPSSKPVFRNATEISQGDPHEELIAAASRAILAKNSRWDGEELLQPQQFTFSRSAALRNQYVKCSWREEQGLWSLGGADCLQLGTMSLELDTGSRWLLVVVLPDGALNANALSSEHSASSEIELMTSNTHVSVNEARISASLIFFGIGFICLFISGTLAWAVSDPLQRMSNDMQRFSEIVRDPDCFMPRSGRPCIKDVAAYESSFRKLLCGISAFSRFIPEAVVHRIVYGECGATRLHVKHRVVTIMFSGIRDINRLKLSEEEVAEVIKRFHIHMTSIVEQNDGSIGEILDDGLLVYWNASSDIEDHATKACECALQQRKGMTLLRADIADHLESVGLSESSLQLSIGIHTGEVLCGNIGSHTKMKFGCIGDSMNLTSRLQGLCRIYDREVMCSDATHQQLRGMVCRKIGDLQVKGRQEPTVVYEVMGCDGSMPAQANSLSFQAPINIEYSLDWHMDITTYMEGRSADDYVVYDRYDRLVYVNPTLAPHPDCFPLRVQLKENSAHGSSARGGNSVRWHWTSDSSMSAGPPEEIPSRTEPKVQKNGGLVLPLFRPPNARSSREEHSARFSPPCLLTSRRSPRPDGYEGRHASCSPPPQVIGHSPHYPPTTPGDRTTRTMGGGATSTAASASHYMSIPSPSPGSRSGGGTLRFHTSRGWRSPSMSPLYDPATQEQLDLKEMYHKALEAQKSCRYEECIQLCGEILELYPNDQPTQIMLEKAKNPTGDPTRTIMNEK